MIHIRRIKHLPMGIPLMVAQNPHKTSPASVFGYVVYHRNGRVERVGRPAVISPDGTKWYCEMGFLHRHNGPAYIRLDGHQEWWREGHRYREEPDEPAIIEADGTRKWYWNGMLGHSGDGPGVVQANGTKMWYTFGKLHRVGSPAVTGPNGLEKWYIRGKPHREGGPALTFANGMKRWYEKGRLHRVDGPAMMRKDGTGRYFLKGTEIPQDKIAEILAHHEITPRSTEWTDGERVIVRFALS